MQAFTEYGASLYNGEEEKEENEKLFPVCTTPITSFVGLQYITVEAHISNSRLAKHKQ